MSSIELTSSSAAREFLLSRIDYERASIPREAEYFKLARMRELLELLGNPQDQLPLVHLAGTKGKGSTAAMIAAMLTEAGKRTGLYTSPHVQRIEERIVAERRMIGPEAFTGLIERIRPVVERLDEKDLASGTSIGGPTYFEILNAAALMWFAELKLDAAVIEVGLGGRLDSTNVCTPKVTVITSIGLDHTKQLGSTLEKIAIEKAGIIKPGVPCVTGVTEEAPLAEIRRIAREREAPLFVINEHYRFEYKPPAKRGEFRTGTLDYVDLFGSLTGKREFVMRDLQLPMLGAHQAANAATAIAATRLFLANELPISPKVISSNAIRSGIERAKLPARLQVVRSAPAVVVDAAHNEPSMKALVETLRDEFPRFRKRIAIVAISRDKAHEEMLAALLPHFDKVVCTRFVANPRACEAGELADAARRAADRLGLTKLPEIQVFERPEMAWETVRAEIGEEDFVCVAGSFFIAAEMMEILFHHEDTKGTKSFSTG
jgi:dihydrofolate synthase / folylpolyglutamate synthase